jgi:ADP-ribosyl-[dinitrogen reductase] hydrolase
LKSWRPPEGLGKRNYFLWFEPRSTQYVIDTIWSVRRALEEKSFEDVVRTAIMFGNDTDTTAAIAGGLAGIRFGLSGIVKRWVEQLRGFELVKPMLHHFLRKLRSPDMLDSSLFK